VCFQKKSQKFRFFGNAMQLHITPQMGLINTFATMRHICDTVDYSYMLITTYQLLLITHYVFYMCTSEYVRHIT